MSNDGLNFRLLSFHAEDKDLNDCNSDEWAKECQLEYTIQMFGINKNGETASIIATDYTPHFYIKVKDNWNKKKREAFIGEIKRKIGKYYENSIIGHQFLKRKTLYGFDAGKDHKFIEIRFKNEITMRKTKGLWYTTTKDRGYHLRDNGLVFGDTSTKIYEANIPPLLRMFHIQGISPSGWISLSTKVGKIIEISKNFIEISKNKTTTCKYEYSINYKYIKPLPNIETQVPYKIASFDIEASSSHGDFPLAKKDYKKLATNIVDIWEYNEDYKSAENKLKNYINTAFNIDGYNENDIELVYPKTSIDPTQLEININRWLRISPASCSKIISDIVEDFSDEENECDEGKNDVDVEETGMIRQYKKRVKNYNKKGVIIDLLNDNSADRDTKISYLTSTLNENFPPLKGDEVTFIGTTFLKYGNKEPYLNHCIVKNSCSDLKQIKNSKIESYKTEKEVLLAWTDLIQREDPDIIIGYNIFGFDYQFMYQRADETDCLYSFLRLSRNKDATGHPEKCISRKWCRNSRMYKEGLEENTIYIASGQHDLKFIKMKGRLQIDLYNYLRRDYQLIKYKLDYVAGYFIGDSVKKLDYENGRTKIYSNNLTGLENNSFIQFEEEAHSVDSYKNGQKFEITDINIKEGSFWINSIEEPDMNKKVRWGLAKDDVTPQDIFRMTNQGPDKRAIIAKYCIQDCNLVHHLMRKIDIITGYIEMASLCSVPLDFLVMRGQGIKLTSYIAKKCREKQTLMPVIEKKLDDAGYEGAIVLDPKCDLYLEDPVACVDYSSLYPSSMISENISHDSKVWTKEYDLEDNLLVETGEKDKDNNYIYDNLEKDGYKYRDITYDTYKWQRKNNNPKAAMEKVKVGYKVCRFAIFPNGHRGIMPSILEELLAARKATRKLIPQQKDEFMKNVLDKRQQSIKVTANSLYGQTGAKTSTFYEKDCAASTTATGRKLLIYGRDIIEMVYKDKIVETSKGKVHVNAEYVYGDTDSVFFKFNLSHVSQEKKGKFKVPKKSKIVGQEALELTIELAKEAGELATKFLRPPHDLEYEKTFWPFCLLSKKRYVGLLYEDDPHKCKRKSMGIVLKRRDNAPIVKDIYGGVIDILMKDKNIELAANFLEKCLNDIVEEKYGIDKLIITKSLRSGYKNPKQIAHKVLADRIGLRDPGNKPSVGDRIAFVYVQNPDKKALQGERIETPEFIKEQNLSINYEFYITNQLMKPLQQVFALVLEKLSGFISKYGYTPRKPLWNQQIKLLKEKWPDTDKYNHKLELLRNKEVKAILFDKYIKRTK